MTNIPQKLREIKSSQKRNENTSENKELNMKNILRLSFALSILLFLGCNKSDRTIGLFFNPSRAYDLQKNHLTVRSGSNIILDTIVINNYIDKSLLLKRFNADLIAENMISIDIDGKSKILKIPKSNQNCIDVFMFYDDHTAINNIASEIEKGMIEKGIIVDYKQIVDSIKKSSSIGFYDKIEVDVKTMNCKK